MAKYAIFRHGKAKFKSYADIRNAEKHNQRTMDVPNADPDGEVRRVYGGNSAADTLKALLKEHGIKPRKNAAYAMEYVLTFSPEMQGKVDREEWINANIEFLEKEHGIGLLSVDFHGDEKTDHLHAICAPLIEKEVRGEVKMRLSGVDFWKGKDKLSARQDRYAEAMAQFGLERGLKGSRATHRALKEYDNFIKQGGTPADLVVYNDARQSIKDLEASEPEGGMFSVDKLKKSWNAMKLDARRAFLRLGNAIKKVRALDSQNKLLQSDLERSKAEIGYLHQKLHHDGVNKLESNLEDANKRVETLEKQLAAKESELTNKHLALLKERQDKQELAQKGMQYKRSMDDMVESLNIELAEERSKNDRNNDHGLNY